MQADRPKQYLTLLGKTVLEHTIEHLLEHPHIEHVVVAVSADDPYFANLPLAHHPRVIRVDGGKERRIRYCRHWSMSASIASVNGYWCMMRRVRV